MLILLLAILCALLHRASQHQRAQAALVYRVLAHESAMEAARAR